MRGARRFFTRTANLLMRRRQEARLRAEIDEHIALQTEENIRAGNTPAEARRQALLKFGAVEAVKEIYRDQQSVPLFENLLRDLKYSVRMLRKSPGFAAVAVITLALGIGANTAIFSVINSALLSNLPVKDPQQLVFLTQPDEQGLEIGFGDGDRDFLTYPEFRELERNNQVFSGLLGACNFTSSIPVEWQAGSSAGNGAPAHVSLVSGSYFSVLGVAPSLGRTFGAEVDQLRDANPVAVISYAFWQGRLGGAPGVIGHGIRILNTSYTVIGVAPPQFHGETVGANPDVWVPLTMQGEIFPGRDFLSLETQPMHKTEWLHVIGRLKPGVTLAQAKASIEVEFHQMMDAQTGGMSESDKRKFLNQYLPIVPGSRGASTLRADFGKPLQILMAVVGLILLLACANIANILLARSAARQKEISVRLALGAGAARLFGMVLTESVLLAAIGGTLGLLLAHWADVALLRMVSSTSNQVLLDLHTDTRILAFTLVVSVLTGILFGLAPAFHATRVDLNSILKGTSRTVAGAGHSGRVPTGKILVIVQVALSLLLLVVAGLFVRSFRNLSATQLGFDRDHLLEFRVNPLAYGYRPDSIFALNQSLLERLRALPGVRGVTLADYPMLSGMDSSSPVTIEGRPPLPDDDAHAKWTMVGPGFFSTTGISLLAGREITEHDGGNVQRVGVINQTMANKFFSGSNPIGQQATVHTTALEASFIVVGVVQDSKHRSARDTSFPRFYVPYFNPIGDEWTSGAEFLVRTAGEPSSFASTIREVVRQAAPNLPPVSIETMDQRLSDSLVTDRMIAELSGAFGVLAVVLVCIGLYGIMAYVTSGRTNEIGIRIALGARRSGILWLILRESLLLIVVGSAVGIPLVFAAGTWISSMLFGLHPADALTLSSAIALMFIIGVVSTYLPARCAMRVDPMVALRYE